MYPGLLFFGTIAPDWSSLSPSPTVRRSLKALLRVKSVYGQSVQDDTSYVPVVILSVY